MEMTNRSTRRGWNARSSVAAGCPPCHDRHSYLYFELGDGLADGLGMSCPRLSLAWSCWRWCWKGFDCDGLTVFGQRDYEANQVSALAWGAVGVGFVLLLVPHEAYAWPLIASLSFGDPLMGELRRKGVEDRQVMIYATLFLLLIWLASSVLFGTPRDGVFARPGLHAGRVPRLTYIDDNATMLLIPLASCSSNRSFS